ncbi:MAG: radical SAM protein [Thermoplasmata archaeon]|nr:MAG: radical SAM protein [Thermoplasmata archaeon]
MSLPSDKFIDRKAYFEEHVKNAEKFMKNPRLRLIIWEATKNCDFNCQHCCNPKEDWIPKEELKTSEVKRFFWEISQDFDAKEIGVGITGGEPTLRDDLVEVIQHISKLGFRVGLSTHGYGLGRDTDKIDRLVKAGVVSFAISLDGMKSTHNGIRGAKCFDEVVRAIRYLRENYPDVKCEVATVVTKHNFKELDQMHRFLEHIGVQDWKIAVAVPIKRAKDDPRMILSDFDFQKLMDWLSEKNKQFDAGRTELHPQFVDEGWCGRDYEGKVAQSLFFCHAGLTIASIMYDGKVGVCLEVPKNLSVQGDLKKRRFSEIWKNEFGIFRGKDWLYKDKCAACSEWVFCKGGAMHNRTSNGKLMQCPFLRLQKIEKKGEKREILIDEIEEIRTAELFPLVMTQQDDGYIVGREEIGSYALFPEEGVETIRLLQYTSSISKVQNQLKNKYHEEIDVQGFVRELAKGGLVKSINEQVIETPAEEKVRSVFNNISQKRVKWLFSIPAAVFFLFIIAIGLWIILLNPIYYPSYTDFFISQRYTIIGLTTIIVSFVLMIKHELAHLFAARAYGAKSRIRISNRLIYIVMETDLSNLWLLPKRKRMVAYLAGMMSDLLLISILLILLYLHDGGGYEYIAESTGVSIFLGFDALIGSVYFYKIAKLIIFLSFIMIAFQFMFYMRTDVYYIVAHSLDCKNLYNDARTLIKNTTRRLVRKPITPLEEGIPDREMKVIRGYAVLHFVGVALVILLMIYIMLPLLWVLYTGAFNNMYLGLESGEIATWYFLDAFTFVIVHAIFFTFLGYLAIKKRKRHVFRYVTDKESKVPDIVMSTVRCPNCKGLFGVEMFSSETQCPHCGVKGTLSYGS